MSMIKKHKRDVQEARDARARWEQAVADGRDHHTVNRYWESYLALAHRAGAYMDIEHEAALAKASR